MTEPGALTALDAVGLARWDAEIETSLLRAVAEQEPAPCLQGQIDARMNQVTGPDWNAYPARVGACLSRADALRLLDWRSEHGDEGRARLQEEYAEWRVVRDQHGNIVRFELTTELAAYWKVLAATQPQTTLTLISEFAGGDGPSAEDIYGSCNPFAPDTTAAQRSAAFERSMLGADAGPYNNGISAICCMRQKTNTLGAMLRLAVAAAVPRVVEDASTGRERPMTGPEATPLVRDACQDGRSSDPVLLERIGRLAFEGRLIGFDDPLGIYITATETTRLRCPDGQPVPAEWFSLSRGASVAESPDGRARIQRLSFEVPAAAGFCVGDLIDVATGSKLRYGGQIAELVQLVLYLRVSDAGAVAVDIEAQAGAPPRSPDDAAGCQQVRQTLAEFEETTGGD